MNKEQQEIKDSEDRIQSDCYQWFHNEGYPEHRGLLCYNLNNSKHKIDGNKNKGLGLQKGRSDLVFYLDRVATMIEMKTPDGYQSPDQKIWQAKIEAQGFEYLIVRSLEEFKKVMLELVG